MRKKHKLMKKIIAKAKSSTMAEFSAWMEKKQRRMIALSQVLWTLSFSLLGAGGVWMAVDRYPISSTGWIGTLAFWGSSFVFLAISGQVRSHFTCNIQKLLEIAKGEENESAL